MELKEDKVHSGMNDAQLVNQDSGNTEYYTPPEIAGAATRAMGTIDLDPASYTEANRYVMANRIYTKEDDGLSLPWFGNVWMNHPFGKVSNQLWIEKLLHEIHTGHARQACCITWASTSEKWFRPLMAHPQCFLYKRPAFFVPGGEQKKGATKGAVVTYIGGKINRPEWFRGEFESTGLGKVKI